VRSLIFGYLLVEAGPTHESSNQPEQPREVFTELTHLVRLDCNSSATWCVSDQRLGSGLAEQLFVQVSAMHFAFEDEPKGVSRGPIPKSAQWDPSLTRPTAVENRSAQFLFFMGPQN